ncbi:tetratricopeptide repeat protein [Uliginosibacterium gangwonense]|uniref:tetratricopeptide repeat protein n=1 Tax=Uliginosibacterium gangwonense TaxID=392736 RepID=UPI000380646E|nr:tetratricopeptide repeat protein [Uliginosibacterium gangwonense]
MKLRYLPILLCMLSTLAKASETPLPEPVANIAHRWATINYQMPEKERESAFKGLALQAQQLVDGSPGKAEPKVWQAIVLASYAKAEGGLGALSKAKQARDLLLEAEKIDPTVLNGSIYTSLGSLYAKVPGWPIGFGDKKKARSYLETALKINPDGIDPHYFYADFLASQGEYGKAIEHLKQALAAQPRPSRPDADAGRRKDVEILMASLLKEHGDDVEKK